MITQPTIYRPQRPWARTPSPPWARILSSSLPRTPSPLARGSNQGRTRRLSFQTDDGTSSTNDDDIDIDRLKTTSKKIHRVRRASSDNSLLTTVTTTTGNQVRKEKIKLKPLITSQPRQVQLQTQMNAIKAGVPVSRFIPRTKWSLFFSPFQKKTFKKI